MMLELWPFAIFGNLMLLLYFAYHKFRIMNANVLKLNVWIAHEKVGDPYFFLSELFSILELFPF